MLDISILPVFFIAIFFLAISPGPDLLLLSSYSSAKGFKTGVLISLGICAAGISQTLLVAFGLGQMMQMFPALAWTIKLLGALYLTYLGLNLIKNWYKNKNSQVLTSTLKMASSKELFYRGFLNNLMNPKALLFFSMFLPQFTNNHSSLIIQILILGLLLSFVVLIINLFFSFIFSKVGSYLGKKFQIGHHVDGILGILFLGLATRLMSSK